MTIALFTPAFVAPQREPNCTLRRAFLAESEPARLSASALILASLLAGVTGALALIRWGAEAAMVVQMLIDMC